jgi:hypothetical protein
VWPWRATKVDESGVRRTVFDDAAHRLRSAKRTLQEAEQGGLKIRITAAWKGGVQAGMPALRVASTARTGKM